jgi:glycosyltransferase involved in cell wall biosynthesis
MPFARLDLHPRLRRVLTANREQWREALAWRWRALQDRSAPPLRPFATVHCRAQYGPRLWLERSRHPRLHADERPLVSVLIATYNRRELLIERALRSVRQQTYARLEVIIVGDGCTDDTEQALARLGDPRITFVNLPRAPRPEPAYQQWLVAGAAPGNEALRRASGQWIAWLDDDDEFSADHVETLLGEARARRLEFVYGQMDMETSPGMWQPNGLFPPKAGKICHGAVFYAAYLRFMTFDLDCWRVYEPNDWNLWRRMWMAGVRVGFVPRIVGRHYLEGPDRDRFHGGGAAS